MKTLFHVSSQNLPIDTVLQPGRFGAAIRSSLAKQSTVDANALNTLAWESALEIARRCQEPSLPSRLNCIFGCPTIEEAKQFQQRFRGGASHIFMLRVQQETFVYVGDFESVTTTVAGKPFLDTYVDAAMKYWKGAPPNTLREAIIGGSTIVIAKVQ
jgi:hypothetical protein